MALRDIRKCNVRGKRVLVRVDYNVDTDARGRLRDLTRIEATVPTVRWLLKQGATVILVTHRGRPQGRDKKLSVRPVVVPLTRLLRQTVTFIDAPILTPAFDSALQRADGKRCILLENIRFESGEEENSSALAKRLASLADVAVNDAFADSHRAHASIVGVAKLTPMFAGLTLQREVTELTALIKRPKRPYVAVIGGAKISTKLHLIQRLLKQADFVLLGGALANTLLQAEGVAIGASLVEPKMLDAASGLTSTNTKLKIPCDVVVAKRRAARVPTRTTAVGKIQPKEIILDIGPDTVELFRRVLRTAKTIVWNGPMGVYEMQPFDRGTVALAKVIAASRAQSIAGGGETVDAIRCAGVAKRFTFLSTGGGAMLEFLEGKTLPGVTAVTVQR